MEALKQEVEKDISGSKEAGVKKLGLGVLIALGIGSIIGGGVFNSPTDLITKSNPQAVALALDNRRNWSYIPCFSVPASCRKKTRVKRWNFFLMLISLSDFMI